MAVIHFEGVPCGTKVRKNPLEITEDKSLVTCKRCLKKLEAPVEEVLVPYEEDEMEEEVVEDECEEEGEEE